MNVYDFDGTIYKGDSSIDFFLYVLKKKPSIIRFIPKQIIGFVRYGFKQISKTELKEYFFSFLSEIDVEVMAESFWNQYQDMIYGWYRKQQRIDDVIISASPEFLLKPICNRIGIKYLIASRIDCKSGMFLDENCKGSEKLKRWNSEFSNSIIEKFYTDSLSDAPVAKIAKKAFMVRKGVITEWKPEIKSNTDFIKRCYKEYQQAILYIFWGICTTIVNTVSYGFLYQRLIASNLLSTVIAWLMAVVFAFFTNKIFVFTTTKNKVSDSVNELVMFFLCRGLTGIIDVLVMLVAVNILHRNSVVWKVISNIFITLINYFASKFIIFKSK